MKTLVRAFLLTTLVLTGCDLKPKPKFTAAPPPTPPLGPPAQRIAGTERLNSEEAMTLADLSLLLRTSTAEDEILRQVARRGFLDSIAPAQAQSLAALGASPRLILVVQDPQYVLTSAERQEFMVRKNRRDSAVRGQATADRKQREAEFAERQRQLDLQQETMNAVAQKEREAKQREQDKLAYEQRRKSLEQDIDLLQKTINDYRRSGYRESELTGLNQRLKDRQDELLKLRAP